MPNDDRSWFGPKRVGFGIRPQTWQGWLVTFGATVVFVVVVLLLVHLASA